MSKVSALYHVVFCTKERRKTLPLTLLEDLYRFIWKEVIKNNSKLIRIGGIQNHVHMLIELHPSIALANLIQDIKSHSSGMLRKDARFPDFEGWGREYFACSISHAQVPVIKEYIKNQQTHHKCSDFDDELISLCNNVGLTYDERNMR